MRRSLQFATSSMLVLSSLLYTQAEAVCRAVAFSGGGARGSYETGVVYGLTHSGNPADFAWDVVTGVSAGALNAGVMGLWAPQDGKAMSEWMESIWKNNITSAGVYQSWPLGWLDGIFSETGLYNNQPLFDLMTKFFKQFGSLKRKIIVSSAEVNTGKYILFDEKMPFQDWPLFVIASSSIPFIFPHRHYNDYILMDGGTVWNTNLVSAVDKCNSMGYPDN